MSLFMRSLLVLCLLFGMVLAVGIAVLYHYDLPMSWAIAYAVAVTLLQFILAPYIIDWIYDIKWYTPEAISVEFADYLRTLCARRGLSVPRFGVIEDGNPNAFTYGHYPSDARLVVTRGLHDMLTEEEFRAVVAHEVGHIRHYDFIMMTLASLASVILYIIYQWSRRSGRNAAAAVVGICAYAAYVLSQYMVLFLSRLREYYADQHASYSVADSNAIATALVKIGYGLAGIPQTSTPAQSPKTPQQTPSGGRSATATNSSSQQTSPNADPFDQFLGQASAFPASLVAGLSSQGVRQGIADSPLLAQSQCLGSLGICSVASATTMALYSTTPAGQFSVQHMISAMQWDLWSPWARYFELHSTHPLIARRVMVACDVAKRLGQQPVISACPAPKESQWPAFIFDLVTMSLPWIGFFVGLLISLAAPRPANTGGEFDQALRFVWNLRSIPLLMGVGWLMRLAMSYGSNFQPARIADLVARLDVSPVRCVPVEIEGTIIGRGIPGILWSKDLVLADDSGFIPIIYKHPLWLFEFLFGLMGASRLIGQKVKVKGWYRRGPSPYVELKQATTDYGTTTRCHYCTYLWVLALLTTLAGIILVCTRL